MKRTIAAINERIKKGQAVVMTAEEVVRLVKEKGVRKATAEVDVVTTGTFGPICSSGGDHQHRALKTPDQDEEGMVQPEALDIDRESWIVSFNPGKCIACEMCIPACPPHAMQTAL